MNGDGRSGGKPTVLSPDRRRPPSYRRSISRELPYSSHRDHYSGAYDSRVSHIGYDRHHDRGYPPVDLRGPPPGTAGPWSPRSGEGRKTYYSVDHRDVRSGHSSSYETHHRGPPRNEMDNYSRMNHPIDNYNDHRGGYVSRTVQTRRPAPYPPMSTSTRSGGGAGGGAGRSRSPIPTRGTSVHSFIYLSSSLLCLFSVPLSF